MPVERGPSLAAAGASGDRLARALGIDVEVLDHVDGADRDEQRGAQAMCNALWPATWGYFLEQLLLAGHRRSLVGGRVPALLRGSRARTRPPSRVSRRQHPLRDSGVVVSVAVDGSCDRQSGYRHTRGPFEAALPGELKKLVPIWNNETGRVPRVGRSGDADADLVGMLETDASAREVRVRSVLGATASFNIASFLSADWEAWSVERARLARDAARVIGRDEIASRLYGLSYAKMGWIFDRGFVVPKDIGAPEPLSEVAPIDFNYIRWIRTASLDDLQAEKLPDGVAKPTALLYLMLRHAFLREVADAGDRVLVNANVFTAENSP